MSKCARSESFFGSFAKGRIARNSLATSVLEPLPDQVLELAWGWLNMMASMQESKARKGKV
jgi:hypothetical protein